MMKSSKADSIKCHAAGGAGKATGGGSTSRLLIKNIPKYYTEQKLREFVEERLKTKVTDVKIPKDTKGVSRKFAFIGLRSTAEANRGKNELDKTYLDTCKLMVSTAFAPGSESIPRPWSRHSEGSSAFARREALKEERKKKKRAAQTTTNTLGSAALTETVVVDGASPVSEDLVESLIEKLKREEYLSLTSKRKGARTWGDGTSIPVAKKAKRLKTVVESVSVVPTKAGVGTVRQHVQFIDEDDEVTVNAEDGLDGKGEVKKLSTDRRGSSESDSAEGQSSTGDGEADGVVEEQGMSGEEEAQDEFGGDDLAFLRSKSKKSRNITKEMSNTPEVLLCATEEESCLETFEPEEYSEDDEGDGEGEDVGSKKGDEGDVRADTVDAIVRASTTAVNSKESCSGDNVEEGSGDQQIGVDNNLVDDEMEGDEEDSDRLVGSTGRLMITNVPYDITSEGIKEACEIYGEVADIHLPKNETTEGLTRGFVFVTFAFPDHAVRALAGLDGSILQGRVIKVQGARVPKPKLANVVEKVKGRKGATSSYKRKLEEKLKKEASNPLVWNLLYVSSDAALEALSGEMNMERRDLLSDDTAGVRQSAHSGSADTPTLAARVALGETHVVHQTKDWLVKEGINLKAFERRGLSLLQSTPAHSNGVSTERSQDTIIVKHIPTTIKERDIFDLFSPIGRLVRCALSPTKSVAVVQFLEPFEAKRAFKRLVYSRFKNIPLYLEWAPHDIFITPKPSHVILDPLLKSVAVTEPAVESRATDITTTAPEVDTETLKRMLDEGENDHLPVSLFVKNLSFATTESNLRELFMNCDGFLTAKIVQKAKRNAGKTASEDGATPAALSRGYGFVEFKDANAALEGLKRMQHVVLDGHALQLKVSEKAPSVTVNKKGASLSEQADAATESETALGEIDLSKVTNKLTVRNLAFQAAKKDLRSLFAAFGNVVAVRIPKKADGTSRGYGFVELASRSEALAAMEALQHTHLYGRKMVIEAAKPDDTSLSALRSKQTS